jgi:hypothetical protein
MELKCAEGKFQPPTERTTLREGLEDFIALISV